MILRIVFAVVVMATLPVVAQAQWVPSDQGQQQAAPSAPAVEEKPALDAPAIPAVEAKPDAPVPAAPAVEEKPAPAPAVDVEEKVEEKSVPAAMPVAEEKPAVVPAPETAPAPTPAPPAAAVPVQDQSEVSPAVIPSRNNTSSVDKLEFAKIRGELLQLRQQIVTLQKQVAELQKK